MTTQFIEMSRSQFSDFLRCRQKFDYQHNQGIEDTSPGSVPMRFGTLGHWGLKHGYEFIQEMQHYNIDLGPDQLALGFKSAAQTAMVKMIQAGTYVYRGDEKPLRLNHDEHYEEIKTCEDVINFYADHFAYQDYSKYWVVSVERKYARQFLVHNDNFESVLVEISGIMDVCLEEKDSKKKILSVMDHKFVGDVNGSLSFLPRDVQMLIYASIVGPEAEAMGYEDVEILYNMVRREVPPGYGSRPETTKSGRKSTASRETEDYLRRELLWHNRAQRARIESNFLLPTMREIILARQNNGPWLPSPIKTGGEACANCFYEARCGANIIGAGQPSFGGK